jgi:hypothetical protein
MGNFLTEVKAI